MTETSQRADYDSPWKDILENYFQQALEFFFPETAAIINWNVTCNVSTGFSPTLNVVNTFHNLLNRAVLEQY